MKHFCYKQWEQKRCNKKAEWLDNTKNELQGIEDFVADIYLNSDNSKKNAPKSKESRARWDIWILVNKKKTIHNQPQ